MFHTAKVPAFQQTNRLIRFSEVVRRRPSCASVRGSSALERSETQFWRLRTTAAAATMEPGIDTCEEEDALLLLQLCKAQRHLRADASPSSAYQSRDTVRPEPCSCLQHVPLNMPPSGAISLRGSSALDAL